MNTIILAIALFLSVPPIQHEEPKSEPLTYSSLLNDWQKYKAICYADSEWIPKAVGEYNRNEYSHRQPTLDGFMDWMKVNHPK